MRILFLNWKDMRHPFAGGAEYVTHRFAQELVSLGHQVIFFTSRPPQLAAYETRDGIEIIRAGGTLTVYFAAFIHYITKFSRESDIIVDQIHGLPFFTPIYAHKPIVAYIHEVAGTIWQKEYPIGAALVGQFIEQHYFTLYRHIPFITDAYSTAQELEKHGINPTQITTIPLTIDHPHRTSYKKNPFPTLVYIGRISPMKQIEQLIWATFYLKQKFPALQTIIAGRYKTAYRTQLQHLIYKLRLKQHIHLLDSVSEHNKYRLFGSAWLAVQPSLKEGFGLTIAEAALVSTPTVAFNVPGIRDTIREGINGVLVQEQEPLALSQTISRLLLDTPVRKKMSATAKLWVQNLPTWEKQTRLFENTLLRAIKKYGQTNMLKYTLHPD